MNEEQKKRLLIAGIALCLLVAGSKIYKFYESRQPLAQPGECLEINDPQSGKLKLHVVENHSDTRTSDLVVEFEPIPGLKLGVPVRAPYDELRQAGAVKVSCE